MPLRSAFTAGLGRVSGPSEPANCLLYCYNGLASHINGKRNGETPAAPTEIADLLYGGRTYLYIARIRTVQEG